MKGVSIEAALNGANGKTFWLMLLQLFIETSGGFLTGGFRIALDTIGIGLLNKVGSINVLPNLFHCGNMVPSTIHQRSLQNIIHREKRQDMKHRFIVQIRKEGRLRIPKASNASSSVSNALVCFTQRLLVALLSQSRH